METVIDIVGALALCVTAASVVPQMLKIARTRVVSGISPTWAAMGAVSTAVWTAYLAAGGLWWAAFADALCCVSHSMTMTLLARHGAPARRSVVTAAGWLTAIAVAYVTGGRGAVGLLLSLSFAVQVAPSVWTAYRSCDVTGVSLATWLLVGVEGVLWGLYGVLHADAAVVVFGVTAVVACVSMIVRVVRSGIAGPHRAVCDPGA